MQTAPLNPDAAEAAVAPPSGAAATDPVPALAAAIVNPPGDAIVNPPGDAVVGGYGVFWPVLLAIAAFLAWTGFQTVQLVSERTALSASNEQQEPLMQKSAKLRQSLDAIAAQTQRLAEQGNPNARVLVEELRKRGVTINPNPNPNPPAAAAPAK